MFFQNGSNPKKNEVAFSAKLAVGKCTTSAQQNFISVLCFMDEAILSRCTDVRVVYFLPLVSLKTQLHFFELDPFWKNTLQLILFFSFSMLFTHKKQSFHWSIINSGPSMWKCLYGLCKESTINSPTVGRTTEWVVLRTDRFYYLFICVSRQLPSISFKKYVQGSCSMYSPNRLLEFDVSNNGSLKNCANL